MDCIEISEKGSNYDHQKKMIINELNIYQEKAQSLLDKHQNVRLAIQNYINGKQ